MIRLMIVGLLVAVAAPVEGASYYVAEAGDDANAGTSPEAAWRTPARVNATATLKPGDRVLFKRGDRFHGNLVIGSSGTAEKPIVYGAYGSGPKPVLSGFAAVTDWVDLGGNIWESSGRVSTLAYTNLVTVNGVNMPMGRFPNDAWLTYESHREKSAITDEQLAARPDWTGAELVMFTTTYILDRCRITAHAGGTLSYKAVTGELVQRDGQRYFIQDDPRTLDAPGEWYYNPKTGRLRIYSDARPKHVRLAAVQTLILVGDKTAGHDGITFENLALEGANGRAIEMANCKRITIRECDFAFSGETAVFGQWWGKSTGLVIDRCTFDRSNSCAIDISGDFAGARITGNTIRRTGMQPGMGRSADGNHTAIATEGPGTLIAENVIEDVGYIGIRFGGNDTEVRRNYIARCMSVLVDGGGIYTWNGRGPKRPVFTGRKVIENILVDSPRSNGLYMDDGTQGVEIAGNLSAGGEYGLLLHGTQDIRVHHNTIYNNSKSQILMPAEPGYPLRNNHLHDNVFVSRTAEQQLMYFGTKWDDVAQFGTADRNVYARPIDDRIMAEVYINGDWRKTTYDLAGWRAYTKQDARSKGSPKSIRDAKDLRMEYNAGASSKTILLDGRYLDMRGRAYDRSITLAPFASVVLVWD